jgi:hypothetical protein
MSTFVCSVSQAALWAVETLRVRLKLFWECQQDQGYARLNPCSLEF